MQRSSEEYPAAHLNQAHTKFLATGQAGRTMVFWPKTLKEKNKHESNVS